MNHINGVFNAGMISPEAFSILWLSSTPMYVRSAMNTKAILLWNTKRISQHYTLSLMKFRKAYTLEIKMPHVTNLLSIKQVLLLFVPVGATY